MGTTLTAAYLEETSLAIAHVGDSRAYLFRDGSLQRLTRDHSLVDELVRRGKLTEEQAAEHPQRSIITRALGPEPEVEVDTWTYPVRAGDVLLLCSDGLTSMVSEEEVEADPGPGRRRSAGRRRAHRRRQHGRRSRQHHRGPLPRRGRRRLDRRRQSDDGGPAAVPEPPDRRGDPRLIRGRKAVTRGSRHRQSSPAGARRRSPEPSTAAAVAPARTPSRSPPSWPSSSCWSSSWAPAIWPPASSTSSAPTPRGWSRSIAGCPTTCRPASTSMRPTTSRGCRLRLVPADRRSTLLGNQLRSQNDATNLVRRLELGEISQ